MWEIYTKQSRTKTTSPMLTIGQKLGRCTLNRAAALQFERDGVEFVLLMFDKDARKWGIRPVTKKDPRSFAVRYSYSKDKGDKSVIGAAFSGVTFLRHIGYDFSVTQAYSVKWDADESIFEVQLPEERFHVQQQPLVAVEGGKKHGKALAGD
jgi:uncharacterized protein YkuJ